MGGNRQRVINYPFEWFLHTDHVSRERGTELQHSDMMMLRLILTGNRAEWVPVSFPTQSWEACTPEPKHL